MHKLTIFLLSRNRPEYARLAIKSILAQSNKNFNLIVSDNSSTVNLREIMAAEFPRVSYVSRYPGVSLKRHFELIENSITTPFFVAFHDDDLMEIDYVDRILSAFEANPDVAAIGTNAIVIDHSGNLESGEFVMRRRGKFILFSSAQSFINQYLSIGFGGAVPFSSYAYRSEFTRGIPIHQSCAGNYYDAVFLSILASKHGIGWINEPLVKVRYHDQRVSTGCGVLDYKAFLSVIKTKYGFAIEKKHIEEYRFSNLLFALKTRGKFPRPALKYFLFFGLRLLLTSSSFRLRVLRKLATKLPCRLA